MSKEEFDDIDLEEEGLPEEEDPGIIHSEGPRQTKESHDWRQEGSHVICRSCPAHHGIHIGMKKIMVGVDDNGNPILKQR